MPFRYLAVWDTMVNHWSFFKYHYVLLIFVDLYFCIGTWIGPEFLSLKGLPLICCKVISGPLVSIFLVKKWSTVCLPDFWVMSGAVPSIPGMGASAHCTDCTASAWECLRSVCWWLTLNPRPMRSEGLPGWAGSLAVFRGFPASHLASPREVVETQKCNASRIS